MEILKMICLVLIVILLFLLLIVEIKKWSQGRHRSREMELLMKYVCQANDGVSEINLERKIRTFYEDGRPVKQKQLQNEQELKERIHPDDRERVWPFFCHEGLANIVLRKDIYTTECRLLNENGEYDWREIILQGMEQDQHHPMNLMLYQRDITVLKEEAARKEEEILTALKEAKEANAAKGVFTSKMSHEIRTPLNAVVGFLTIARNYLDNPKKLEECVDKCQISAKHLLAIVNDVLDMSTIESGKMKLAKESFSLTEQMTELRTIFSPQASEKGIMFQVEMDTFSADRVMGDPMRVNQILINLISNALKFSNPGGIVIVSARELPGEEKDIMKVQFQVSDNGIGMKRDFLGKIFEPYEQQSASVSQRYGGTGLGMAITNNLVSKMGGKIHVESQLGEGSSFQVILPFEIDHKASVPFPSQEETLSDDSLTGRRILVVEDNEINSEIAVEILHSLGIESECAFNGLEAVDKFAASESGYYQMILMDLQMPILDGVGATERIRKLIHPEANTIPIVAMTANTMTEDVERTIEAGMNDFLAKPVDIHRLVEVLKKNMAGATK